MKTLLSLFLLIHSLAVYSCTTFVLKNDSSLVFGRNLDWVSDDGLLVVNKRNVKKTSLVFPPDQPTYWTSKYGSVSFNQFGQEFPFGGINEKGLVVEIMLVAGSYPRADSRSALNELQWVQYQLDNCKSIEEVIASDTKIRISKINQNLHFLICDSQGNVAVIEFDENGMKVYRNKDLPHPVLENDSYSQSLEKNKNKERCRFRTASNMVSQYEGLSNTSPIDYSFKILDKVALDGSWSIVYDIKKMEIHFKTSSYTTLRKVKVLDFDFECQKKNLLYDLKAKDKALVNSKFVGFSEKLNSSKFQSALKSNDVRLPNAILKEFQSYPETCTCTKP